MADRMGLLLVVEGVGQYENAAVTVKQINADVAQSMMGVAQAAPGAQQGTAGLATAFAKGNIAAQAITKGLGMVRDFGKKLIVDSTELAARVNVLGTVLEGVGHNAGYSSERLAEVEKTIKANGITTQATRQSMIMMVQANVDLAQATDLSRVAQNAARIANTDSSEAFERLIYGLSRGNGQILNTMGLTVDFTAAEKKLADQMGTTEDGLSNAQVMQARYAAVMEASTPIADAYTDSMKEPGGMVKSLVRLQEELSLAIGQTFQPAYGVLIRSYTELLKDVTEYLEEHKEEIAEFGEKIGHALQVAADAAKGLLDSLGGIEGIVTGLGELDNWIVSLGKGLVTLDTNAKATDADMRTVAEGLALLAGGVAWSTSIFKSLAAAINETVSAVLPLVSTLKLLKGEMSTIAEWSAEADKGLSGLKDAWDFGEAADASIKAFEDTVIAVGRAMGTIGDLNKEQDKAKDKAGEVAAAVTDEGDALTELSDEALDAGEALAKLMLDLQRDYADRMVKLERDRIKKEIDLAHEREDLARENAENIEKAYDKADQKRVDLAAEAFQEQADQEKEGVQKLIEAAEEEQNKRRELDVDYARTREDIERDLRRKLEDIQQQFEMSVEDAARTRDAAALVMAQRRARQETEQAKTERGRGLEDAKTDYAQQVADFKEVQARQREEVKRSLEEQRSDLEQSLAEKQAAVEAELAGELADIETQRLADVDGRARKLAREQEMEALQAQWEEEDRQRRLERQLQDMEMQYGKLEGITAQGLLEQTQRWAETYGEEGAVSLMIEDWADWVEVQARKVQDAIDAVALAVQEAAKAAIKSIEDMRGRRGEIELEYKAPPELQLHSPKLGIQLGLEELEKFTKQPLSITPGGRAPAGAGGSVSRQESYSRTDATQNVNLNVPQNLDLVVQQQLLGIMKQSLSQAGAS